MSRILITGGGGFLGAWLARRLARRGLAVRLFDVDAARPAMERVADPLDATEMHAGDIVEARDVDTALRGCTGVVHLAGVLTPACSADPVRGAQVNLVGTLQVFEAARRHGLDRVVYASTAGVYGPDDGAAPCPATHYGAFKLAVEGSARAYWRDHQLASTGLRPFVVYGPGRETGASAGPSLACRAAAEGRRHVIGYRGTAGLVYVDDVAEAFENALLEPQPAGARVFDLVGEPHSTDDVAAEIRRQVPGADILVDGPPLGIATPVDSRSLDAWFPGRRRTSLRDGIAATIAHYREPR